MKFEEEMDIRRDIKMLIKDLSEHQITIRDIKKIVEWETGYDVTLAYIIDTMKRFHKDKYHKVRERMIRNFLGTYDKIVRSKEH